MKTDKIVHVLPSDISMINYVCDLTDEGYILLSTEYLDRNGWTVYHLRKTPFTWLMTKISKKL